MIILILTLFVFQQIPKMIQICGQGTPFQRLAVLLGSFRYLTVQFHGDIAMFPVGLMEVDHRISNCFLLEAL